MNEKIKELGRQAGYAWMSEDVGLVDTVGSNPEKFAELIVKECALVSKQWFANNKEYDASLAIKQTFGVK
jgi:hypothetical protein